MKFIDEIKSKKIYGIIREDDPQRAIEIAKAYIEGGIKFIELNCSLEVTKEIFNKGAIIIQGGIITTRQAGLALSYGAHAISSPIFQTNLVRFASCNQTLIIPSATTPNEAYNVWKSRIPLIKIYPVSELGSVEYIKDMMKPMPFLNLLPCGFVKFDEVENYIKSGAIAVGIGRALYANKSYNEIVKTAQELVKLVNIR